MAENKNIELTYTDFTNWVKSLNTGRKRLWLVLSIVWVLYIIIPSIIQYTDYVKSCNYSLADGLVEECNIKYRFKYILWALAPPIILPTIAFVIAWIRSGYKNT